MSLWTPHGEHRVPDERDDDRADRADRRPADAAADRATDPLIDAGFDPANMTDEQRAQLEAMAEEMAETQRRLASVPAAQVIANHAIGLFELAAIHLQASPPQFDEAGLAIDALAAIVDVLGSRLGDQERPLRDALAQIRMAYVQLKGQTAQDARTSDG